MRADWEIKNVGEVCKLTNGFAFQSKDYTDSGFFVIRIGNVQDGYVELNNPRFINLTDEKQKKFILKQGDILVSLTGNVGRVGEIKEEHLPAVLNQRVAKISLISNSLNKSYLLNYLASEYFLSELKKAGRGAAQQNISTSDIEKLIIPLPPLPEQQRIVAILDECFAALEKAKANAEQNLKNSKELFESYLQGVFEKKGEGWEEKFLEDLADESCTLSYGIVQPGEEVEDGLPVVRPTDLTSRFIKIEGLKRIDPKLAEGYKRTKLVGDELLLCVRGTTGVLSIATPELKNANVTRGIVPIRFNSKFINQEFGYYLLISNYVQKQIRAKTYGAALMQINIGDLRKILTPYPSIKDQQAIVQQLDALRAETQRLEVVYQQKLADLEELKKSILQKAFAGELTDKSKAS
jgi:type I restriction enzyme S subunit